MAGTSPSKQSLTKYCNDKYIQKQQSQKGVNSCMQNVHQRLREYQGSHGKTSVSKALFQSSKDEKSPSGKITSTLGKNLRF